MIGRVETGAGGAERRGAIVDARQVVKVVGVVFVDRKRDRAWEPSVGGAHNITRTRVLRIEREQRVESRERESR